MDCGPVEYSRGVGDGAGKTNVEISGTFRIEERMPICFQQVGAVWLCGLIFLYKAFKFPYGLNRRPCACTQNVLGGSSIKKEELECPDGRAIYSWLEVESFSCENIVTVIGCKKMISFMRHLPCLQCFNSSFEQVLYKMSKTY